jgi:uncharacterized membrane protein
MEDTMEPHPDRESTRTESHDDELRDTNRIEAFSDGVFAIAITLLVLELHVPPVESLHGSLLATLAGHWPSYVAFLVSFAILGIMWANHHDIFSLIARADRSFAMLNLALLLLVVVQPFITALVAEYLRDPAERSIVVALYAGTLFVTALAYNALWRYAARRRRLIGAEVSQAAVDLVTSRYRFGPIIYLAAVALAFVSATASLVTMGALALFFALPLANRRPRRH